MSDTDNAQDTSGYVSDTLGYFSFIILIFLVWILLDTLGILFDMQRTSDAMLWLVHRLD